MLRIENLSFSYGKQKIFHNFNLHVPGNQVCLVTGINGVGKSTLLRLIAGVLKPAGGKIIFNEKLGSDHRKKMGFISDRPSLYEDLTVDSGIRLPVSPFQRHALFALEVALLGGLCAQKREGYGFLGVCDPLESPRSFIAKQPLGIMGKVGGMLDQQTVSILPLEDNAVAHVVALLNHR